MNAVPEMQGKDARLARLSAWNAFRHVDRRAAYTLRMLQADADLDAVLVAYRADDLRA
jgi:hypothetical protein